MKTSLATSRAPIAGAAVVSLDEVLEGLRATPKYLTSKLFYDDVGAALFERITELPEYYLTRAELEILEQRVHDIASLVGPDATVIDLGSGAAVKTRLLLAALQQPAAYVPIDVARDQLDDVAARLAHDYAELRIQPVCADYTQLAALPLHVVAGRVLVFFPGSTIGNLTPAEAAAFLGRARSWIEPDGLVVLGIDRYKDAHTLNAAYNDSAGVTAAFNLNMLARLNREFGASFQIDQFRHHAFFNAAVKRIEMHLVSCVEQRVRVGGHEFAFAAGESLLTEYSYKYDRALLHELTTSAGLQLDRMWTDSRAQFNVVVLRPAQRASGEDQP